MLMPSIFGDEFFDDFFRYPTRSYNETKFNQNAGMMNTDVKETDQGYEVTMNLPGMKKENVKAELKDGYLTINASTSSENDEKDEKGKYIRRERYCGSCSRSFYVGEDITQEDIKAKFEDGTLKMLIPKKDAKTAVETKKYISIEG